MKKKTIERLLIFFIGVPLVVFLVIGLPQLNHLAVNIVVVFFTCIGGIEFAGMLQKKGFEINKIEAGILGIIGPVTQLLNVSFGLNEGAFVFALITGASWALFRGIFPGKDKEKPFAGSIHRTVAGFAVIIYPGFFLCWLISLCLLRNSSFVILCFLLMVFGNDSFAWFFGMLLGQGNRGIVPVSPNKSLAGFIGGTLVSTVIGYVAAVFLPNVFRAAYLPAALSGIIIGLSTAIAASLGDLAESAIKRSAGVKDSGAFFPGRGGVLDSLDSIAFAAPVFYILYRTLF
ncbi:MAG: phosphatidate cytidylyltransferase [Spirochaetaceae bacterium]|jgi:phosphatidate cytidylyltransferase|nr:phosphatidate cytidylyltransferase [Spirochaetaceae bacterium]